jgi:hypothetical protein
LQAPWASVVLVRRPVGAPAAVEDAAAELVDDHDLVALDNILLVLLEERFRLGRAGGDVG